MADPKAVSFDLNSDMLDMLHREFDVDKLVERFAQQIEADPKAKLEDISKNVFQEYGKEFIRRTIQLGEEYPDRTYEVLKEADDHLNGYLAFPLIPQRFLEIAYLSIQEFRNLPIMQNNPRRLTYRVPDCKIFQAINNKLGDEIAESLYCKHLCVSICENLMLSLGQDSVVTVDATREVNKYCQFSITKA